VRGLPGPPMDLDRTAFGVLRGVRSVSGRKHKQMCYESTRLLRKVYAPRQHTRRKLKSLNERVVVLRVTEARGAGFFLSGVFWSWCHEKIPFLKTSPTNQWAMALAWHFRYQKPICGKLCPKAQQTEHTMPLGLSFAALGRVFFAELSAIRFLF
jgi:hypothetical protein